MEPYAECPFKEINKSKPEFGYTFITLDYKCVTVTINTANLHETVEKKWKEYTGFWMPFFTDVSDAISALEYMRKHYPEWKLGWIVGLEWDDAVSFAKSWKEIEGLAIFIDVEKDSLVWTIYDAVYIK